MTTYTRDKNYEDLVISYVFGSLDDDQVTELESDPECLANEVTRLTMEFVAQRELWEEKLRTGECSADEYHDWKRRSNPIRFRLQGKAPHVKTLIQQKRQAQYLATRNDKAWLLTELIRDHHASIVAHDIEPETWDTNLWEQAEKVMKVDK